MRRTSRVLRKRSKSLMQRESSRREVSEVVGEGRAQYEAKRDETINNQQSTINTQQSPHPTLHTPNPPMSTANELSPQPHNSINPQTHKPTTPQHHNTTTPTTQ